jgi:hypothetical protein
MATITCPSCGAPNQEVGKFCENCGFFIASADATPPPITTNGPTTQDPSSGTTSADPTPVVNTGVGAPPVSGTAAPGTAQFAVVRDGVANPAEGFTITRIGEYLVGRTDLETGSQADIDLRQWVQPMEIQGQRQYIVHRRQCYLALTAEGDVTIRMAPGAELDTLIKPAGSGTFTPIQTFGTIRNARPDTSYELEPGDQIFMGDPEALPLYQSGSPTAAGSYLVIELLPRA